MALKYTLENDVDDFVHFAFEMQSSSIHRFLTYLSFTQAALFCTFLVARFFHT